MEYAIGFHSLCSPPAVFQAVVVLWALCLHCMRTNHFIYMWWRNANITCQKEFHYRLLIEFFSGWGNSPKRILLQIIDRIFFGYGTCRLLTVKVLEKEFYCRSLIELFLGVEASRKEFYCGWLIEFSAWYESYSK